MTANRAPLTWAYIERGTLAPLLALGRCTGTHLTEIRAVVQPSTHDCLPWKWATRAGNELGNDGHAKTIDRAKDEAMAALEALSWTAPMKGNVT